MSLGAPASATTPTPAGKPLDGSASPAFEAVTEHATGSPASTPAAPGAAPAAMPSWMSSFFGGGSSAATSTTGSSPQALRQAYVPGTSLSGYGMPRERPIWQAPTPVAGKNGAPGSIPDIPTDAQFDPNVSMAYGGTPKALSPEQQKMMDWVSWVNKNTATRNASLTGNA